MADSLMLADARRAVRPARRTRRGTARPIAGDHARAGADPARRPLDGGILITAEAGRRRRRRRPRTAPSGRSADAPFVTVDCDDGDAASVDRLLFGQPAPEAATDLESVACDSGIAAARGGTLYLHGVTELRASTQAQLARIARDGEVRIDGAPVDDCASSDRQRAARHRRRRARAPLPRRPLSPAVGGAHRSAAAARSADDVPALAARLLDEAARAAGCPPRTSRRRRSRCSARSRGRAISPNFATRIQRVVAEGRRRRDPDRTPAAGAAAAIAPRPPFVPSGNLREARQRFERDYIASVLQHHGWRMAAAAQALGIQRPNLYRKARQLGIPLVRVSE